MDNGVVEVSNNKTKVIKTVNFEIREDIPEEVYEVIKKIEKNKFNPPKGVRGNRKWLNRDSKLPIEYEYREFDIHPKINDRNKIRIVFGSDGSIYYTVDHYETFIKLK
ncbi:ribonuclease domain-containing protein [Streptobacillus canis]|uniref:ribonuclease domain-containing protein n=1 Tax=Streptobacillus canis TaxID=2678686 RepID=UPI0012E1848B